MRADIVKREKKTLFELPRPRSRSRCKLEAAWHQYYRRQCRKAKKMAAIARVEAREAKAMVFELEEKMVRTLKEVASLQ